LDLFSVRTLPYLARRNYYYEFLHLIPWSIFAGLVEGQFASVVVAKSFHAGEFLIAVASATPVASLLFSLVWGMLCIGRPKVRLLTLFCSGTLLLAGGVCAIPQTPTGTLWFIAQIAAAQVLLSGVVTVRSAVWKSNYPKHVRGQITARLQRLRRFITVVTVLIAAKVCDFDASSYRFIYPAGALFGIVGIWMLQRVHIRGERAELRGRRLASTNGEIARDVSEPFALSALLSPGHVWGQMIGVLRDDRDFRQYCIAQSLTGVANLMTMSIIVALVTRELDFHEDWEFWISTALIAALPNLAMLGSIERWGSLFDRLGVLRMRVVNVVCWTVSLAFAMAAALVIVHRDSFGGSYLPLATLLFVMRAMFQGVGLGGGQIAWNIGHLHFASPDRAELYMGVHVSLTHVSLTGMRGLIAPLGGMWLWRTIGWPVWLIAIAFSLLSLFLYAAMAKAEQQRPESR